MRRIALACVLASWVASGAVSAALGAAPAPAPAWSQSGDGWLLTPAGGQMVLQSADGSGIASLLVDGKARLYRVTTKVTLEPYTPGPGPEPPIPPPTVDLSTQVRDWAIKLVADLPRRTLAVQLAANFEAQAKEFDAGKFPDPRPAIAELFAKNVALEGDLRGAWEPFWQELRKELNTRATGGMLKTQPEHAACWRDVAKGLREAGR